MKTVLITGISRGIGKALAETYLNNDWYVIGTFMKNDTINAHKNLETYQLDLSKPDSIRRCVERIKTIGKKIDILHNKSGISTA